MNIIKKVSLLCLSLALCITIGSLSGCSAAQQSQASNKSTLTSTSVVSSATASDEKTLSTPAAATVTSSYDDQTFLNILAAGNTFVKSLKAGQQPQNARALGEQNAVEAFKMFVNLDSLYVSAVGIDRTLYYCIITGKDLHGRDQNISVYFDPKSSMNWFSGFIQYAELSKQVTETYIKYLNASDAQGLAQYFSEGGPPSQESINIITKNVAYYTSHYDLSQTTVEPDDVLKNGFLYEIRDAKGKLFYITLTYGDGMCYPKLLTDSEMKY